MKTIKFLSKFLLLIVILIWEIPSVSALEYPAHEAAAVLLVESSTGQVLYSDNADARIYPASTTKIMTALLVIEAAQSGEISLDDMVTASETAINDLPSDSSTAGILPGEQMSAMDLLCCALISSANEACNILGEYIAGSVDAFVSVMNSRAGELGCTDTNFTNTHGLPDDNHYTTARDLSLITQAALQYDLFEEITNTVSTTIAATNLSEARELTTTNKLLTPDSSYYYEYASGVKTGYTGAAGSCLVSTAKSGELDIIAVVMGVGIQTDGAEAATTATSFSVTAELYEWAFENYSFTEVLTTSENITSVAVSKAKEVDSVILKAAEPLSILLPNDYAYEDLSREIVVYSEESGEELEAPISAGDVLGEITLTYGNTTYGPISLVANSDIELSSWEYMKGEITKTLGETWVRVLIILFVLLIVFYITFVAKYNRKKKYAARSSSQK